MSFMMLGAHTASPAALRLPKRVAAILRKFGNDAHVYMPGPGVPILGPNLVTNGDFSNGLTGWNANGVGAVVGGELQITAPGNTPYPGCNTLVTTIPGRVYSVSISGRRGTSSSAAALAISRSGGFGNLLGQAFNFGTAQTTFSTTITSDWAVWDVLPHISGTPAAAGTCLFDNIEIREILGYISRINGFEAANFLESTGNTYAALDGAVGLVLDAAGSVGAELIANPDFSAGYWYKNGVTVTGTNVLGFPAVGNEVSILSSGEPSANKMYAVTAKLSGNGTISLGVTNNIDQAVRPSVSLTATPTDFTVYCQMNGTAASNASVHLRRATGDTATTVTVHSLSWKRVTGTHATQKTTANKPILRRGIVNLLTDSYSPTAGSANNAGRFANQSDPKGGNGAVLLTENALGGFHRLVRAPYSVPAGALTVAAVVKRTSGTRNFGLKLWDGLNDKGRIFDLGSGSPLATIGAYTLSEGASVGDLGGGWFLCVANVTAAAGTGDITYGMASSTNLQYDGDGSSSIAIFGTGLFQGTLTAQQILAAGGIPLTTTAPASSSAGAYAWEFDGSNDSLTLSGSLFQMADDHCVVAAARCDSNASNYPFVFAPAYDTNANGAGVAMYVDQGGFIAGRWRNSAGNSDVFQIAGQGKYMRGVPFVGSLRRVGNIVGTSFNGTLGFSGAAPTGNSAANTARIGVGDNYLQGAVYAAIAIKGTVSDAELRVLEKWLGSIAGVPIA